jgi:hypothetical protein
MENVTAEKIHSENANDLKIVSVPLTPIAKEINIVVMNIARRGELVSTKSITIVPIRQIRLSQRSDFKTDFILTPGSVPASNFGPLRGWLKEAGSFN